MSAPDDHRPNHSAGPARLTRAQFWSLWVVVVVCAAIVLTVPGAQRQASGPGPAPIDGGE